MELTPRRMAIALIGVLLLCLVLLILITDLPKQVVKQAQDFFGYGGPHSDEVTGSRDLFHSGVPIQGRKGGETYGAYDGRRDGRAMENYFGYGCLEDCRQQEIGYRWAARQKIEKPRECSGSTWAILEGCAAYVLRED